MRLDFLKKPRYLVTFLWVVVVGGFLTKEVSYWPELFKPGFFDATSECFAQIGGRHFLTKGFWANSGLPVYSAFRSEGPLSEARPEVDVYTHFLPGPDIQAWIGFLILGDTPEGLALARLPSFLILLFAIIYFSVQCGKAFFPSAAWLWPILAAALFSAPAIYGWTWSLFGHAQSSACVLLAFCLGLKAKPNPGLAFSIGMFSNLMLLEGAFTVTAAPVVAGLLIGNSRPQLRNAIWIGVGLCAIFFVHLLQVKVELGSWKDVWIDQAGVFLNRSRVEVGPSRLQMVGQYHNYVQGMFRLGSLTMLGFGVFLTIVRLEGVRKHHLGALVLSFVSASAFPFILKVHSNNHAFRVPRQFLILYVTFLVVSFLFVKSQWEHRQKLQARRGSL